MDPTAPKDNLPVPDTQTPSGVDAPPNPIQPGQFVVAGEEEPAGSPPAQSSPQKGINLESNPGKDTTTAQPQTLPAESGVQTPPLPETQPKPSQPAPALGMPVSNQQEDLPSNPPPPGANLPPTPPAQPDPTPYVPAQPTTPPIQEPSKMNNIRKVAIIIAAVVLVGLIAAVVWFTLLSGKPKEPLKTEGTSEAIQEPPSLPKRTSGGFGDIPQATNQATPAAETTSPEPSQP